MSKLLLVHTGAAAGTQAREQYLATYESALRDTGLVTRCVLNVVRGAGEDTGQAPGVDWPDAPDFYALSEIWTDAMPKVVAALPEGPGEVLAYLVDHRVQKEPSEPGGLGLSDGVKNSFLVRRASGMTHEAFVSHWLERHVPLALRHHVGMSKYVTDVVTASLMPGAPEVDGVAHLHFATEEDFETGMFDDARGQEIIAEDVRAFLAAAVGTRVDEYVAW